MGFTSSLKPWTVRLSIFQGDVHFNMEYSRFSVWQLIKKCITWYRLNKNVCMLQQTPTLTAGDLWVLTEISVPITSCPMYFPCHQSPDPMPRPPQLPKSFPEKILFPWQLWAETRSCTQQASTSYFVPLRKNLNSSSYY